MREPLIRVSDIPQDGTVGNERFFLMVTSDVRRA
jgi:hypothetical protein